VYGPAETAHRARGRARNFPTDRGQSEPVPRTGQYCAVMEIEAVGRELADARGSACLIEAPSRRHHHFSLEDGYAVGRLLRQWQVASGAAPIGVKLGFTNQAVERPGARQSILGTDLRHDRH